MAFYGEDTDYVFRDQLGDIWHIQGERGVEQGDPLAPVLFAWATVDLLEYLEGKLNSWAPGQNLFLVRAYLDDVVIIGPTAFLRRAISLAEEIFLTAGLELNRQKTQVWGPGENPGDLGDMWKPDGIVILGGLVGRLDRTGVDHWARDFGKDPEGSCGVVIGNSHVRSEFLQGRLAQVRDLLTALGTLEGQCGGGPGLQVAYLLWIHCGIFKLDYLMRYLETTAVLEWGDTIDSIAIEGVQTLLRCPWGEKETKIASLPRVDGGLGIRPRRGTQSLLPGLKSWATVLWEWGFDNLPPEIHSEWMESLGHIETFSGKAFRDKVQNCFEDHGTTWGDLFREGKLLTRDATWGILSPRERERLEEGGGWAAGAFLGAVPVRNELVIKDEDFRVACLWKLGNLPRGGRCAQLIKGQQCEATLDHGHHLFKCVGLLGARSRIVHHPYVTVLAEFMRAAGCTVRTEYCEPGMGPKARLDLVELPGGKGGWAAYDVIVVCPGESSNGDGWEAKFAVAAKRKRDTQHKDRIDGLSLVPLVVSASGRWSSEAENKFREWEKSIDGGTSSLPWEYW